MLAFGMQTVTTKTTESVAVAPKVDWVRWRHCLDAIEWLFASSRVDHERFLQNEIGALGFLPLGTVVAVKVTVGVQADELPLEGVYDGLTEGLFVSAPNGLLAMDLFEERFGKDAIAWVHEIGVPITLGGGLWALSSGA